MMRRKVPSSPLHHASILLVGLGVCAGCGPRLVKVNGQEMTVRAAADELYDQGKKAQAEGDNATAKTRYQQIIDQLSDAPRVPDALGELGAILMTEGGCEKARGPLEKLASKYPLHVRAKQAKKSLAECDGTAVATGKASKYNEDFNSAGNNAAKKEVASKAANAALELGEFGSAVRWLVKVHQLETDSAQKEALKQEISELIDSRVSFIDVRKLLEELKNNDFPKGLLSYKLGRIQYHVRDLKNAKESLAKFMDAWPDHALVKDAKALIARIEQRAEVKPTTIGVILPMSGRWKPIGASALKAVKLGAGSGVNLVLKDSKGDPLVAAKMVEELVLQEGVIAIVGPLLTKPSEAAGFKAQQLGVPLMSVSRSEVLPKIGPYAFRNGVTRQAQAEALVRHAMEIKGMKRFAVLHPEHPYGEEFLHLFWDEVAKRGGEIRGVESYAIDDTTFSRQVKTLVARDRLDRRADFIRARKECDKQPDSYRRARCKEELVKNLKPIIDFDGLFIPDRPKSVQMISAALAFEDIIVEQDARRLRIIERTLGRRVKPVTLLGASGWNSKEIPERAERNVENAIFTDGFFAEAEDKATAQFVRGFTRASGRQPNLPEALFYDSIRIVQSVISKAQPKTREAFREALRKVSGFAGVTGKTSFASGTDAQKTVKILTIKNGKIKEVPPPAPSGG